MCPMRPLNVRGFLVGSGNQPVRVHTDALHRLPIPSESSLVKLDERQEPDRRPADYRQHQPEAVARGPAHPLRTAAHANPHGPSSLWQRRTEVLIRERRAELARPRDWLVPQQAREKVELLLAD